MAQNINSKKAWDPFKIARQAKYIQLLRSLPPSPEERRYILQHSYIEGTIHNATPTTVIFNSEDFKEDTDNL